MSATLADLQAELHDYLHSFTGVQEDLVALTQPLSATDTQVQISGSTRVTRGIIQIDDELIWVEAEGSGTLTIPPFGRGFRNTVPADHAAGSMVVIDPTYPNKNLKAALLQVQQEIYPEVYAVKTATFNFNPSQATYALPGACQRILAVTYDMIGPSKSWAPIRRWELVTDANTTAFANGKAIDLREAPDPGRTVQVVYAGAFDPFTLPTDTLVSLGHQESHRDLLVFGAAYRLLQFSEAARLSLVTAEAQARSAFSQPGAATNVARQVYALFQQRLQSEAANLSKMYPVTSHMTR